MVKREFTILNKHEGVYIYIYITHHDRNITKPNNVELPPCVIRFLFSFLENIGVTDFHIYVNYSRYLRWEF